MPEYTARPFELSDVRLLEGPILDRQERNKRYLLELDPDRLLHNFRTNTGLPSSAKPLSGWEAPDCGLRGHFVGHYLSACAQMYSATGDEALKDRAALMVHELAKCQNAVGSGYLSAFPESDLEVIETTFTGAWASYYTLHKILAGLVDVYRHCGIAQSLEMATRLADYIGRRIAKLSPEQIEGMCHTAKPNPTNEFGGMAEVLLDLYSFTRNPEHVKLAEVFDRDWFVRPLMNGEDRLSGLHANTHIPIALGLARRYELTGGSRLADAVKYFWQRTALARSYVNGASSGPRPDGTEKSTGGEHWPEAFKLASTLTPKINESCVTHNMMRLADVLFRWTGEPGYAAFYERAYFNSLLCMQHPGYFGGYIYGHPLGSHSYKEFGHADDTFWCCYGTGVEAFSRLANGIYYHADDTLWINLPVASELNWTGKGVRVTQQTRYPDEETTRVTFQCAEPVELAINLRVPSGTAAGTAISVNGKQAEGALTDGSAFVQIRRTWTDADVLETRFPRKLHVETMPDDAHVAAFLYGPIVLAARSDEELVLDAAGAESALLALGPDPKGGLTFRVRLANGAEVELVPLNQIVDEKFGVYFRLRG